MNEIIGKPIDRVDGRLKVTGAATYSAEFHLSNMAYAVTVQSTVAKGHIRKIDTRAAEDAPGVIGVITYKNAPMLHHPESGGGAKLGEKDLLPLQGERIHYGGQHIAIVVAETFEEAQHAASLVKVEYNEEQPVFDLEKELDSVYYPKDSMGRELQPKRGNADDAFNNAPTKIVETYTTPVYHHNAMEPHATIAQWNGDELTVYDSTQSVLGSKNAIAQMLGIQPDKVHLISLFIGGGFGSKGFTWPHSVMAPMAAQKVGRPVKLVLSRQQMFTSNGHRAKTIQKISLGADKDGKLQAVKHETITETSFVDEFTETAGLATSILYSVPDLKVTHGLVRLNKGTPCPTRAPGEAPGTFAIESAMDELAYKVGIDPIKLRLINYAEKDLQKDKPWSGKNLEQCYKRGADAIGWSSRNPAPRSMRQGDLLVGYGMATAIYPGNRSAASAKVQLFADGHAIASCCTQDIGTGTYTIMTQIAAEALGLPVDKVKFKLGDSDLPKGPGSGGSQTAASVGPAVQAAGLGAKTKILKLAAADKGYPLYNASDDDVIVRDGRISLKSDVSKGETYSQILKRHNLDVIEEEVTTNVSTRANASQDSGSKNENEDKNNKAVKKDESTDRKKYSFQSFGAMFARVLVDPYLGKVKVDHLVGVMDIGTVLNMKTATNQIMGGMIFALGMALMEETIYDPNNGKVVTRDLANYLVPVNADIPSFDIQFIEKPDFNISPIGARGIGEIGITGTTAAIVNAVYHATGKRVRNLPITPDKLI